MTRDESYHRYDEELHSNSEEGGDEANMIGDRIRVKDIIMRFERSSNTNSIDEEEYVERLKKTSYGNLIHPFYNQSSHDRNSTISVNSVLSGASEASCESNSSGFVSDRKSGTDFNHPPVPHRPAPPPPEPFNDSSSSTSRSPMHPDFTSLHDKRFSLPTPNQSPVVLRRARQPPCVRRKSSVSNQGHQGETLWSYGVKQSDLEILLRLKRSELSDNEDHNANDESKNNVDEEEGSVSSGGVREEDEANDDGRTETVSIDLSTDTLKNEGDVGSDAEENFFGSDDICDRSNYDNVSIKSISSFDNMVPYQYDSVTVSSDEFGSELCNAPEQEFLTVSAVNEWCVAKSTETVLPVENQKEKYRR